MTVLQGHMPPYGARRGRTHTDAMKGVHDASDFKQQHMHYALENVTAPCGHVSMLYRHIMVEPVGGDTEWCWLSLNRWALLWSPIGYNCPSQSRSEVAIPND